MKGLFVLAAVLLLALICVDAANYAKKQKIDCDSKGSCKVMLGKVGTVKLPALVAFKTAHDSYLSVAPPNGGFFTLARHPKAWEEWEMQRVGDKVAFKSHHGTYLSTNWNPGDGYVLASERLAHELFSVEELGGGKIALKGHNGHYLSAFADEELGIKQESSVDDWEKWSVDHTKDGNVVLKSAHGTYLGASVPMWQGNVSQTYSLNTWETFVIDHVDKEKLTIETSHDTYVAAQASMDHPRKVISMDRASLWEMWTPWVNATTGQVCLEAHDGTFMWANENTFEGMGLQTSCMEHELLQVVLVDEKMLAEAAAKAAADRKKAEAEARTRANI